jgi:hypothetical protein
VDRKLQAFLVACFAPFRRKKESGPEGPHSGEGYRSAAGFRQDQAQQGAIKEIKQKQLLENVVLFYHIFAALIRLALATIPTKKRLNLVILWAPANGTRMSCSPVATCDFTNIRMNIMKT